MAVDEEPVVPEVVEIPLVVTVAASSSASKSLWKVSSLLFPRRIPFGFRLKGLENMDKDLDDSEEELELVVDEDSLASARSRVSSRFGTTSMDSKLTTIRSSSICLMASSSAFSSKEGCVESNGYGVVVGWVLFVVVMDASEFMEQDRLSLV